MESISDWIMEPVDDSLQLSTDAIEINWRGNDEHICLVHLLIDEDHVILLGTDAVRFETCIASQTRIHLIITYRDYLYLMML